MTRTRILSHIYYFVCLIAVLSASIPLETLNAFPLPASWRPWVAGIVMLAAWAKGHWNLIINPDGTSCYMPYVPEKKI
jgi:hypothetical protein